MLIQISLSKMHKNIPNPKDYLVVEDVNNKSTWHLPISHNGVLSRRLMGNAFAALTVGFRGNKYKGPKKREALVELKRIYKQEGLITPDKKRG